MVGNRIRKQNTGDAELDTLHPDVARDLLAFNLRKQRIVDLCNEELELDPLEGEKAYSSFHRAMNGHDAYVGIVQALEGLQYEQKTNPRKYLPKEGPGEDLAKWMAQIAKATWWFKILDLNMSESTLNAWFSGRGKKERPDVREQVDAWWARVQAAVDQAERATDREGRDRHFHGERDWGLRRDAMSWDTWCRDLIEDGLSIDQVRDRFMAEGVFLDTNSFSRKIIDLSDPQDPTEEPDFERDDYFRREMWEKLIERDFSCAVSRIPPDFDTEPTFDEKQWGDRRNEGCPEDLNAPLYDLHYRTRYTKYWDREKRCVATEDEIVAVSRDGVNWTEPTERQKRGWDKGFNEWMIALDGCKSTDNSYTQELRAARVRVKSLERTLSASSRLTDGQVVSIEAKLVEAREDVSFAYHKTKY